VRTFFDSSSLAKRYVEEVGSDRVEALCIAARELAVSVICRSEVISALCRLRREKKLGDDQYAAAKEALLADLEDAAICDITSSVQERATAVLEEGPVRAMDALHVACALEWKARLFVSGDQRSLRLRRRQACGWNAFDGSATSRHECILYYPCMISSSGRRRTGSRRLILHLFSALPGKTSAFPCISRPRLNLVTTEQFIRWT